MNTLSRKQRRLIKLFGAPNYSVYQHLSMWSPVLVFLCPYYVSIWHLLWPHNPSRSLVSSVSRYVLHRPTTSESSLPENFKGSTRSCSINVHNWDCKWIWMCVGTQTPWRASLPYSPPPPQTHPRYHSWSLSNAFFLTVSDFTLGLRPRTSDSNLLYLDCGFLRVSITFLTI